MNPGLAIKFVEDHGSVLERAQLKAWRTGESASEEELSTMAEGQRMDGGFAPFWATDYSSVDATCFRLAQAEALLVSKEHPIVHRAVEFLVDRQHSDGHWSEDVQVLDAAPPWAKPGDEAATLYLTANAGFWLAYYANDMMAPKMGASYLRERMRSDGTWASFLHTQWLGAGLLFQIGDQDGFDLAVRTLEHRVRALPASSLAWLLTTWGIAGVPKTHPMFELAQTSLMELQQEDGRWRSEDGEWQDVHTTLEALRVLVPR